MSTPEDDTAVKSAHDYLAEISILLRRKSWKNARRLAGEALNLYPEDPFVVSYFGFLTVIADRKRDAGIKVCKQAIKVLKKSDYDNNAAYPWLYLNLGRAYLVAGDKQHAFDSFHKGLARDKGNKDLLWELKKLGIRRPPVISFLSRSNFINKYMGKIRHWFLTR